MASAYSQPLRECRRRTFPYSLGVANEANSESGRSGEVNVAGHSGTVATELRIQSSSEDLRQVVLVKTES